MGVGSGRFRLGPLVGLLAFSRHIPDKLSYYKSYAEAAKTSGLFYVFRKRGINDEDKTITGYNYDFLSKCWKSNKFPFPDVVIDRRYPNSDGTHSRLTKVIGRDKIFNKKTMITKTDFYVTLKNDSFLVNYLPETQTFRSLSDLEYLLAKYKFVVLKPVSSMKGSGVVAVRRKANDELECNYKINKKDIQQTIPAAQHIFDVLATVAGRKRKYIIQQGINGLKYHEGPFSIRTCPTKNGEGKWVIPGILALGSGKSLITNFASGGNRIPLSDLLGHILPNLNCTKDQLLETINNLTVRTAECLDKRFGPLGELGIDIILDSTGKPWLLEANGNSGRPPLFFRTEFPEWRKQVYQLPIEYATYLAGFQ